MPTNRKAEHVEICATKPVQVSYNYWDDVFLEHQALPEINKSEIDLSIKLFNKKLQAPIVISGMTGGYPKAKKINSNLAAAAADLQIGLGVGSQRPALQDSKYIDTYSVVKEFDIPLVIANIGVPQLVKQRSSQKPLTVDSGKHALEMVGADILAIHLNFVQEVVQFEGETNARGCFEKLKEFASELPILAKETGAGISHDAAKLLKKAGVRGIDVGGLGGTSFPAVEMYRGELYHEPLRARLGRTFWDWGIPTPVSLLEANVGLPLIATGGLRDGLDAAKALYLGASAAGFAGRMLKPALESKKSVLMELEAIIEELRCAMFLTGSKSIKQVNTKYIIITGEVRELLTALGYKI